MPDQHSETRLWRPDRNVMYGSGMLSGGSDYYGPRLGLADGLVNPLGLPGLRCWYDFTALGLANGATVSSVPDLSGNAFDLAPSLGTVTFITNRQNGLGAMNYDNARTMFNGSMTTTSGIWTVMWVGLKSADSGTCGLFGDTATDPFITWTNTTYILDPGTTVITVTDTVTAASGCHVFLATATAGSTALYRDDFTTPKGTGASAAISAFAGIGFATSGTSGTDLYGLEFAVWDGVLTSGNLTALDTYLSNKYAITIA